LKEEKYFLRELSRKNFLFILFLNHLIAVEVNK